MQANDSPNEPVFATCRCRQCENSIEFPVEGAGQSIECPHCGMVTQLHLEERQRIALAKCECDYCRGGIEFDQSEVSEENSLVPCPHCGEQTKLRISQKPSTNSGAGEHEREAQLKQIRAFLDRQDKTAKIFSKQDSLELAVDKIIIRRRGIANMLASGLNGERTILISALTVIQMKPGSFFSPGYILFSYAGSKPFPGGIIAATQDPDAFIFDQSLNEQVVEFKTKVEKIMRAQKQAAESANLPLSLSDELRKLADLKAQGLLSDEEFDTAKRKLLQ